ncbi:MAG: tetratricopeptide repeat protein [Planctomycetales bacterium]|nr:tetratricopeptide repeat protein [Planctomycetales bacterium]
MSTGTRFWFAGLAVPIAAALCCGCALERPTVTKGKLPPPLSPDRKAEAVAMFESQRDQAQLQAAMNRWKEGNTAACERALASLVGQRPQFVDAHVQYAELMLSQNNPGGAANQLREALQLAPDRADIHHSLAIALEAGGDSDAANKYFRKALELEPESPVYQMAVEDLQGGKDKVRTVIHD